MVSLAAICLNEEEFIEAWLRYHYDSFDRIVIAEGAARDFPRESVTADGLSSDRTAEIVGDFPDPDKKIQFIQHGWAGPAHSVSAAVPAKMELRNVYAERLDEGYVYTLDIDEFLHPRHIAELNHFLNERTDVTGWQLPFLHLWQDSSHFITGGFADQAHYRLYRWRAGSRYIVNHNWPSGPDNALLTAGGVHARLPIAAGCLTGPAVVHYGFCEDKNSTADKNDYYILRGENTTRAHISEFRNAALRGLTPQGCAVHDYLGFLPIGP